MNFAEIEKEINNLAKKANDGSLSIDEMAGGTFTISNGGVYGSLLSTPIINPPQVLLHTILSWLNLFIYFKIILLCSCLDISLMIGKGFISLIMCWYSTHLFTPLLILAVGNIRHALYSDPSNGCWGQYCSKANDVYRIDLRSSAD